MNITPRNILRLKLFGLARGPSCIMDFTLRRRRCPLAPSHRRRRTELRNHEYTIPRYAYRSRLCESTLITYSERARKAESPKIVRHRWSPSPSSSSCFFFSSSFCSSSSSSLSSLSEITRSRFRFRAGECKFTQNDLASFRLWWDVKLLSSLLPDASSGWISRRRVFGVADFTRARLSLWLLAHSKLNIFHSGSRTDVPRWNECYSWD